MGDQAPFTTRQLDWTSHQNVSYRVKYTVTWYQVNGAVKGTLSHWYSYYDNNFLGQVGPVCLNQYSGILTRGRRAPVGQPWSSPSSRSAASESRRASTACTDHVSR